MALVYFSHLPEELKEKIVRDHLQQKRKLEFLDSHIHDVCRSYEALTEKEDVSSEEIMQLSHFLQNLCRYYSDRLHKRCIVKWKSDVPISLSYGVMEEFHIQLFGFLDLQFACTELFADEYRKEEDLVYEDGVIFNSKELDMLIKDMGLGITYIIISKGCISVPEEIEKKIPIV